MHNYLQSLDAQLPAILQPAVAHSLHAATFDDGVIIDSLIGRGLGIGSVQIDWAVIFFHPLVTLAVQAGVQA